jgi:hypothetical protein
MTVCAAGFSRRPFRVDRCDAKPSPRNRGKPPKWDKRLKPVLSPTKGRLSPLAGSVARSCRRPFRVDRRGVDASPQKWGKRLKALTENKAPQSSTAQLWLLWERARTRRLRASSREQARSHTKQGSTVQHSAALALAGTCSHAAPSRIQSRASLLPQKTRLHSPAQRSFGSCGSVLARDAFVHPVASKLAPTENKAPQSSTAQLWLLWERARTRRLRASSREQARSHTKQGSTIQHSAALALVGACSHAAPSCIQSRASSLPHKTRLHNPAQRSFGSCGSVLARGAFVHPVTSKLAPTENKASQSSSAQLWLLWERARTRRLRASSHEQARSHRKQGFTVQLSAALALVGACSHAAPSCIQSRASSLPHKTRLHSPAQRSFGSCGSVLARDAFVHPVASKLAPTNATEFTNKCRRFSCANSAGFCRRPLRVNWSRVRSRLSLPAHA